MLSITLKLVNTVSDWMIIRTLRNSRLGPNPGLNKRTQLFQNENIKFDEDFEEEEVAEYEADFSKAGKMYRAHVQENKYRKDNLRKQIVEQKYFKESMPNLLTWSEKEQIRHLHSEEPNEWTPEKIAECFPVTAAVVKKLLKYPWKPATEDRISRHDVSALRNWRELKEGTLDIPPELQERFLKFSERTIPPLKQESIKTDTTPPEKLGEFQAIIDSCARNEYTTSNEDNTSTNINEDAKESNTKHSNKRMTLDELTNVIKKRIDSGTEVNVTDQIILQSTEITQHEESIKEINSNIEMYQEKTEIKSVKVKDDAMMGGKDYPERIRIPKKAYKRGATYKVDDCYYNCDGRLLYRVLGLDK